MCDEYLINLWMEFGTDSVERRLEIVDKVREFFRKPTKFDFKIDGDDGVDMLYFNHYYMDHYYMEPESVRTLIESFGNDILAFEYNVDEVEYNNIKHLYVGDVA